MTVAAIALVIVLSATVWLWLGVMCAMVTSGWDIPDGWWMVIGIFWPAFPIVWLVLRARRRRGRRC